jgi:N-acetylglucosaminyldiphosphoundecaprenol N-acetyl-beta-D-mannosaminyltransferase
VHMHRAHLSVPVCIGVGGSLDFLAGRTKRAPVVLQGLGLEWLFRLVQEPGRLWRRYLRDALVLLQIVPDVVATRLGRGTPQSKHQPLSTPTPPVPGPREPGR